MEINLFVVFEVFSPILFWFISKVQRDIFYSNRRIVKICVRATFIQIISAVGVPRILRLLKVCTYGGIKILRSNRNHIIRFRRLLDQILFIAAYSRTFPMWHRLLRGILIEILIYPFRVATFDNLQLSMGWYLWFRNRIIIVFFIAAKSLLLLLGLLHSRCFWRFMGNLAVSRTRHLNWVLGCYWDLYRNII